MKFGIALFIISLLALLYYAVQDAIGKRQAMEWEDYKKEHPELFPPEKKPEPVANEPDGWENDLTNQM